LKFGTCRTTAQARMQNREPNHHIPSILLGCRYGKTIKEHASSSSLSWRAQVWTQSQGISSKAQPSSIRFKYKRPLKLHSCVADQFSTQIIVARMGITFILSSAYMWWRKVPDFPLGARSVRGWLLLRAAFGFGGLYCLYCMSNFNENPAFR
jgi:hypothetical protein